MRTPAAAIAWELRTRHRWGLGAIGFYLLLLAAVRVRLGTQYIDYRTDESFAFFVVVPITFTFIYLLAVFTYGLGGDIAAPQSMYPARMFTLPVSNTALAGWPMLFGCAAMALLWIATRYLALWPKGQVVPIVWPALLAASLIAWTQALTWMPYPLPGMRVILSVLWLATIDAIVMIALQYRAHEWAIVAMLAPHVPLAFLTARYAVTRARRGADVSSAHARRQPRFRAAERTRRSLPFPSPSRAQLWFEWRLFGRTLPALVAILLPCELALLALMRETPSIVFAMAVLALLTPPLMAGFVAPAASSAMTPFIARRPLTGNALIAAKLKAALLSTAAAWAMVLIATPLVLRLTGTTAIVRGPVDRLILILGLARTTLLLLLVLLLLIASTWKQLVQSLCIGMTGRPALVKGSVFATLCFFALLGPVLIWIVTDRHRFAIAWNAMPTLVAAAAALKIGAAILVLGRLRARRLLTDRSLLTAVVCWDAAVFAIFALLAWSLPGLLARGAFMLCLAILAVPLVRLAAAPLAVAWNRNG
jgi:hypothetical protein